MSYLDFISTVILIYGWVGLVKVRVLHALPSSADPASAPTAGSHFLGFFCSVLCISLVSPGTICLCIAQILFEFLLVSC
jgi:hypothetical protein